MSSYFHSVWASAPGVDLVPKPLFPWDHVESSNSGLAQPLSGILVV